MSSPQFPSWLARSKTLPHTQLVSLVSHSGLTDTVVGDLTGQITLIIAPAGYGKSTLLSSWRRSLLQRNYRVAWLNLDDDDNDPVLLATYLLLALHEAGLAEEVAEFFPLGPNSSLSPKQAVATICTMIGSIDHPVVLILDSFEVLCAATAEDVIQPLIEYQPPNLHILIASRTAIPVPLSGLRVQGLVNELNAQDLRFSRAEVESMFGQLLDGRHIDLIENRTEGWPVALQILKSKIVQNECQGDIPSLINAYEPKTGQYISEQFFSCLSDRHREFLQDTAMLELIVPEIADFIRESSDSLQLLNEMDFLEAFVAPLGESKDAYRLHPLFREFLCTEGCLATPERWSSLNLRAATWFEHSGNIVRAMRYCIDAGEPDEAGRVLEEADGLRIWFQEGISRVQTALHLLPELVFEQRPRLKLLRALTYYKEGKTRAGRDSVIAVQEQFDSRDNKSPLAIDVALATLTLAAYEGVPNALVQSEAKCFGYDLPESKLTEKEAAARSMICLCQMHQGSWREAEENARITLRQISSASSASYGAIFLHLHLGLIALKMGDVPRAEESYQKVRRLSRNCRFYDENIQLVSDVFYAELIFERCDIQEASKLLRKIDQRLAAGEAWYEVYSTGYFLGAMLALERDGLDGALQFLRAASRYIEEEAFENLERFLVLIELAILIRTGKQYAAQRLVEKHGLSLEFFSQLDCGAIPVRERYLGMETLSQIALDNGANDCVIECLTSAISAGESENHVLDTESVRPLLATALFRSGRQSEAFEHLGRSLAFAEETRLVNSIINKSELLEPLILAFCVNSRDHKGKFGQRLLERVRRKCTSTDTATTAELKALSSREHDVLNELARGYPDKIIARNLNVSANTVRFHLKSIFRKLDVDNRSSAIREAHKRNFISMDGFSGFRAQADTERPTYEKTLAQLQRR